MLCWLQWNCVKMQAFHLFDQDKDGLITTDELIKLIDKVGGSMTEGEARGLIRQVGNLLHNMVQTKYIPLYTRFLYMWWPKFHSCFYLSCMLKCMYIYVNIFLKLNGLQYNIIYNIWPISSALFTGAQSMLRGLIRHVNYYFQSYIKNVCTV